MFNVPLNSSTFSSIGMKVSQDVSFMLHWTKSGAGTDCIVTVNQTLPSFFFSVLVNETTGTSVQKKKNVLEFSMFLINRKCLIHVYKFGLINKILTLIFLLSKHSFKSCIKCMNLEIILIFYSVKGLFWAKVYKYHKQMVN